MKSVAHALIAITLLSASASAQSHPAFWRYVHPDARSMFGLDLRKAKSSPLGQRVSQELQKFGVRQMATQQGFDFVTDVDQVLISSPGGFEDASKGRNEVPMVIALSGRFSVPKLRKKFVSLGARRSLYKGAEIFQPKGKKTDLNAAIVNGSVMLLGDPESIRAAIGNHAGASLETAQSELFARASALSQLHDIWWVSEISPASLAAGISGAGMPQAEMLRAVRAFEGGISLREGIALAMSLRTADDTSAKQMELALQALLNLSLAGIKDDQPEAKEFLSRVRITAENSLVNAQVAYSTSEITMAYEKAMKARMGIEPVTAGGGSESVLAHGDPSEAPIVAAAPPEKFVIRIFNAEGGTREVPLARD
ncbi:MAG: hypothetical protein R2729_12400 [Bryobacteraceae bacterium]